MDVKTDAIQIVDEIINSQTRKGVAPKRLFIGPRLYAAFSQAVEPIYREQYGALVMDELALQEGWDNIRYRDIAICLAPDLPQDGRSSADTGKDKG